MKSWRPRLRPRTQAVPPLTTIVKAVTVEWRHLNSGAPGQRKRKFLIYLPEPVLVPTPRGAAIVMRDVVQTWDPLMASICERSAARQLPVRIWARETSWGLELIDVTLNPEES